MRQELIDLLLGELDPAEAEALKARLTADPELRRELTEIESLFTLMRRGEELEPAKAMRATVLAAAARARPPLAVRLRMLPGLVAYRFRYSVRFRVAMISLSVHLVAIAVLAQILLVPARAPATPTGITWLPEEREPVAPAQALVIRLSQRRLPSGPRLKLLGAAGQEEAIQEGLAALVKRQEDDGSFGELAETGYATLALLAEGDCSTRPTARGRAIRAARERLLHEVEAGGSHGAALAALVEDYALAYDDLSDHDRRRYQRAIRDLLFRELPEGEISREALLLASLAGFAVPAGAGIGEAEALLRSADRALALSLEPTRFRVTLTLARGAHAPDAERARAWAAPLFERAIAEIRGGNTSAVVLLALQAPYRL
jgi:hypothetical protein